MRLPGLHARALMLDGICAMAGLGRVFTQARSIAEDPSLEWYVGFHTPCSQEPTGGFRAGSGHAGFASNLAIAGQETFTIGGRSFNFIRIKNVTFTRFLARLRA
jgi:hypothetical protein